MGEFNFRHKVKTPSPFPLGRSPEGSVAKSEDHTGEPLPPPERWRTGTGREKRS